jgi:hypothetical protein
LQKLTIPSQLSPTPGLVIGVHVFAGIGALVLAAAHLAPTGQAASPQDSPMPATGVHLPHV